MRLEFSGDVDRLPAFIQGLHLIQSRALEVEFNHFRELFFVVDNEHAYLFVRF